MFENSKIIIEATNSVSGFNTKIELYHNVNIIAGMSGTRKTALFNNLIEDDTETVVKDAKGNDVEVFFVSSVRNEVSSIRDARNVTDRTLLFIVDDVKGFYKNGDFLKYIHEERNRVFLLYIGRDTKWMLGKNISCFSEAVYMVKLVGKMTMKLEKVCDYFDRYDGSNPKYFNKVSTCISECKDLEVQSEGDKKDKRSGEQKFLENFFYKVYTAGGKCNVCDRVRDLLKSTNLRYLYIFVDMCAYGSCIYDLYLCLQEFDHTSVLICEQLSYEYTILEALGKTDLITQDTDFCVGQKNNIRTFEEYVAEILATKVIYGNCGKFGKDIVPNIFLSMDADCSSCFPRKREKCVMNSNSKADTIKALASNSKELYIFAKCSKGGFICLK